MTLSRRSTIKAIGVVGAGSAVSGTALAVSEHEDDERDPEEAPDDEERGAIRVGHFSPDAPNVDVYVDDQQILSDVGYDELSPYLEIEPGTYTMSVTEVDGDEPVYEQTIVVDTEYYTAAAIGELEADDVAENGFADDANGAAADEDDANETDANETETAASVQQDDNNDDAANESEAEDGVDADEDEAETGTFEILLLVDDGPEDVEEGTAHLRLVHASPDAPAVDVAEAESGLAVFEDVDFGEPSGYVPVDAGTQALDLFEATEGDLAADDDANGDANETEADQPETAASIQQDDDDDADDADDDENNATELDDDENNATELDDDEIIEQDDPVATAEIELDADMAYTAYAIGYLEEEDAASGDEADDEDDDETDDDEDDRSFEVRLALDGTEEDEELDDEPDEAEPEEEEIENGDDDENDDDNYEDDADDNYEDDDHGHDHDAEEEPMTADD